MSIQNLGYNTNTHSYARFEVFTAAEIQIVFWVAISYSVAVTYQRFRGCCCLCLQAAKWRWRQQGPYHTATLHGITAQKTTTHTYN